MAGFIFKTIHLESAAVSPPRDTPRPPLGRRFIAMLAQGLSAAGSVIVGWYQGFGDRQLLASLDDRQLRDLGLDRADLGVDSTASHWRLPGP